MNCPKCKSSDIQKRGIDHKRQRYSCNNCGKFFKGDKYFKTNQIGELEERPPARVLLFDIETLPIVFYGWKLWDMITSPEFIIKDWCVLSYAAKWLFEPEVITGILSPKQALIRDDKKLVEDIWKLFEQADVVIAHNGVSFDLSKMNTRFIFYDMKPPKPYQNIDTFLTAKKYLGVTSNALDYLGAYLKVGRKHKTDFEWWVKCDQGDAEYLTLMNEYNVKDITLLEDVYVKLRPWIKHPNMSLFMDIDGDVTVCTRCGSTDLKEAGEYYTEASVFDAFRCNHCGGIGRAKKRSRTTGIRTVQTL